MVMKSDYGKKTYAEEFDAQNDITGAIPEGSSWAVEFRSICEDADREIAGLNDDMVALRVKLGCGLGCSCRDCDTLDPPHPCDCPETGECYRVNQLLALAKGRYQTIKKLKADNDALVMSHAKPAIPITYDGTPETAPPPYLGDMLFLTPATCINPDPAWTLLHEYRGYGLPVGTQWVYWPEFDSRAVIGGSE
jgi:hypothetical protein